VLKRDVIFVAREQGQPAGYVALRREEGGRSWSSSCSSRPATSGVASDTGCSPYAEGYAIAERARWLHVVVEQSNQPARSFYRRSGFVPVEPELFELILPSAD